MRSGGKPSVQRGAVESALTLLVLMAASGPCFAADPGAGSTPSTTSTMATTSKKMLPPAPSKLVDVNSATRARLKTLPRIGDEEASRIIAGRPYFSKADLATRNVIPTGVYLSLKNQIIAIQTQQPKARN